jgi:hypothetical protein
MSYNIVRKSKSTILVHKFRDPNNPNKVVEKYLLSMGVQTDARHKEIRSQVNELAQEDRINFCQRSGLVVEVPEDVPRRKTPTGDIREQPVKKVRKTRKKSVKAEETEKVDDRPLKQSVVLESDKPQGLDISKYKGRGRKIQAINKRIEKIEKDIIFSKTVVKQKKGVATLSKSQQMSVNRDIVYHESVIDNGRAAIRILQKQKSGVR